jgi:hypothetical protein
VKCCEISTWASGGFSTRTQKCGTCSIGFLHGSYSGAIEVRKYVTFRVLFCWLCPESELARRVGYELTLVAVAFQRKLPSKLENYDVQSKLKLVIVKDVVYHILLVIHCKFDHESLDILHDAVNTVSTNGYMWCVLIWVSGRAAQPSSFARTVWSWVRISLEAWMSVFLFYVYVVLLCR